MDRKRWVWYDVLPLNHKTLQIQRSSVSALYNRKIIIEQERVFTFKHRTGGEIELIQKFHNTC